MKIPTDPKPIRIHFQKISQFLAEKNKGNSVQFYSTFYLILEQSFMLRKAFKKPKKQEKTT